MIKRYTSIKSEFSLFMKQEGKCAKCRCRISKAIGVGAVVYCIDHIIALARGGDDTDDNKQLLCEKCHKVKTGGSGATSYGSDIHEIAKEKRLIKGKKKPKTVWAKRKFPKKEKR